MPEVIIDYEEQKLWQDKIIRHYNDQQPRDQIHVSDLLICLRRWFLIQDYEPIWNDPLTLFRFEFGRALEDVVGKVFIPEATQELELIEHDIVAHIDFGSDPHDYETKFTWSKIPTDPNQLFKDKWYWIRQNGIYATMRRRLASKFLVFHTNPQPLLMHYTLYWDKEELSDIWNFAIRQRDLILRVLDLRMQFESRGFLESVTRMPIKLTRLENYKDASDILPPKTIHSWACNGCPVKTICDQKSDRGL